MRDETVIIFTGDSILLHGLGDCADEGFLKVAELIATADAAITNLEVCISDGEDWPAFVAGNGRGTTYFPASPRIAGELRGLGFSLVSTSNNHAVDFGESGVMTTLRHLDDAGVAHAGSGATLSAATAPGYVNTSRGRVALINAADWGPRGLGDLAFPWPMGAMAADSDPVFRGRPGMNLMRYDVATHVDSDTIEALRRASVALGWEQAKAVRNAGGGRSEPWVGRGLIGAECDSETEFHFMGRRFVVGDEFTFETVPFEEDIERNCRWIREARRVADYVVVGMHQQGAARSETEPPDHTRIFAEAAIEAGADLFVAHGRGRVGGVKIHHGKPIVFGVPTFINQNDTVGAVPSEQKRRYGVEADATPADFFAARLRAEGGGNQTAIGIGINDFRPSVIHAIAFAGADFKEIRLYPIETITDGPKVHRGLPRLLDIDDPLAARTLDGIVQRMVGHNVDVQIRNGVAVLRPSD